MKSVRYLVRLASTFFVRHRKGVLLGFSLGVATFLLLPMVNQISAERQKTQTIGLVGRYTLEDMPNEVLNLVSLGLTELRPDGTPKPGLAKDWTVENDGKQYTFHLQDNLAWQDKTPVKAEDINYNFKDAQISVIDEKTIRFTLKEPFSPFPVVVSRPVFKKGLVGTGSYRIRKITHSGNFVESVYLQTTKKGQPDLFYRFYPTESVAKIGLKLGEVKTLKNIADKGGFEGWDKIKITPQIHFDQYLAIFFNTQIAPFSSKNFRQTLAYAIPKTQGPERTLGPISPRSWAYSEDVKPYEYDLTKAKQFLAKELVKDKKIEITLSTAPYLLSEAETIAKAWETLGLKVNIGMIKDQPENTQALLAIQVIPPDPDQYTLWHSTQEASNITQFKSPRIDKLLEDGRKTVDREKRKKIYFDFQKFLIEEAPVIFLSYPFTYEISRQ